MDEVLEGRVFGAILLVWSTVIGYYNDVEVDIDILRRCRRLAHDNTYLLVLRHINRDHVALIHSLMGSLAYLSDLGNGIAVIERPVFDEKRSVLENCWSFYRVEGEELHIHRRAVLHNEGILATRTGRGGEEGWMGTSGGVQRYCNAIKV